jgi:hypothetical protein
VADGTRTHDHRDHNPGLYQLSYRHRAAIKDSRALPRLKVASKVRISLRRVRVERNHSMTIDVKSAPSSLGSALKSGLRQLKPKEHFDHAAWELILLIALGAALALGTTLALAWVAGFGAVWDRLHDVRLWWIPIALAGQIVAYVGYMLAYREVARVERGPELGMMKLAAAVFTGFGVFVAHGGFSADVIALEGTGISKRDARVRVLGLGALEYVLLAPAACACAIILLAHGTHKPGLALTLPWAIAVPLGFVAAWWALRFCGSLRRRNGWRGAIGHGLEALGVVRRLAVEPHHGAAFLGMGLYWAGEIFSIGAALHAFGSVRPAVAALVIGYATGYALTRRTLPLAGAGAVELLLPLALLWSGATLASAVLAVFVYRFFNLWMPLIPAVAGYRALGLAPAKLGRRAQPVRKAA